jgi:hypothetical protein
VIRESYGAFTASLVRWWEDMGVEEAMSPTQTSVADWLQIIRGEFAEVPGLHLTRQQFQKLWGLDGETTSTLLDVLVNTKFLRRTSDEGYVRLT